jgi:hypothetical protein
MAGVLFEDIFDVKGMENSAVKNVFINYKCIYPKCIQKKAYTSPDFHEIMMTYFLKSVQLLRFQRV